MGKRNPFVVIRIAGFDDAGVDLFRVDTTILPVPCVDIEVRLLHC